MRPEDSDLEIASCTAIVRGPFWYAMNDPREAPIPVLLECIGVRGAARRQAFGGQVTKIVISNGECQHRMH